MYLTTVQHQGDDWTVDLRAEQGPTGARLVFHFVRRDQGGTEARQEWKVEGDALEALYTEENALSGDLLASKLEVLLDREAAARPAAA